MIVDLLLLEALFTLTAAHVLHHSLLVMGVPGAPSHALLEWVEPSESAAADHGRFLAQNRDTAVQDRGGGWRYVTHWLPRDDSSTGKVPVADKLLLFIRLLVAL